MSENKLLVYIADQYGKLLDATVMLDTGTPFAQEAAGRYVAGAVEPGRRTVQAEAPGYGSIQIQIDMPDYGQIEQHVLLPRYDIVVSPSKTVPPGSVLKVGTSPVLGEPFSVEWDVIDLATGTTPHGVHIYNRLCNECIIDSNLAPGTYAIQCKVRYNDDALSTTTKRLDFTIEEGNASTASQEQWEFYNRAKNLALIFKDNFDKRVDELNRSVSGIGRQIVGPRGAISVQLLRPDIEPSSTRPIWIAIMNRTEAMSVPRLEEFLNRIFCPPTKTADPQADKLLTALKELPSFNDVHSYDLLRTAVEAFLIQECGVVIYAPRDPIYGKHGDPNSAVPGVQGGITFQQAQAALQTLLQTGSGRLPYIDKVVQQIFPGGIPQGQYVNPFCYGILQYRDRPCLIELIWSYWHEEGMLVQSMATISRRFQNIRGRGERDPLAQLTLEPLRPLSNLLFGYIQEERDRLSLARRAYEYDHEYGIRMVGRAVPVMRTADSRSKFLEAFHNLLSICSEFYLQADDTTVVADGFKVLNSLREVHLLLSQGAHNQYNDLVWRARAEMLLEQWLLGREELRQFLPSKPMVVYPERWMAQVDTMKQLQGWTDTSVIHFGNLARFGEQLLLSIRFDDWNDPARTAPDAADWAIFFRPQIQGYAHEYRVVTGVDLSAPISADAGAVSQRYAQPSAHLGRRSVKR